MAWIYLAVSEGSLPQSPPGCAPSPTASEISSAKEFYSVVRIGTSYHGPRSGMTCERWTDEHCRRWTSSTADSPARISALQVMALVWLDSEAAWSSRCSGWCGRFVPPSRSLRTSQLYELEAQTSSSKNWPALGMTRAGALYRPLKSERRIFATVGGSLLPTPSASSYGNNRGGAAGRTGKIRHSLPQLAKMGLLPHHEPGPLNPLYVERMMGYPLQWTVCEPWATPSSQRKRAKPSSV